MLYDYGEFQSVHSFHYATQHFLNQANSNNLDWQTMPDI